ncbi:hypothetical protein FRC09_016585 [Ceratobasidium sp. 395]|nr:hypothetical protein FRC09_016585 [Ceratobasidium sp. 395]
MLPTLDESSQNTRTPSQFAHLKTTEPTTTASGVIPGRAAFDTPSPNQSPAPALKRSDRSRKPSSRKLESQPASATQPASTAQPKSKQPAKTKATSKNGKHGAAGNANHASTSQAIAHTRSNVRSQTLASKVTGNSEDEFNSGGEDNDASDGKSGSEYEDDGDEDTDNEDCLPQEIIEDLEALLGHSVSHLSSKKIKELLDAMPQTQAPSLETQGQLPQEITKSLTGVGLAGGDGEGHLAHEGSGNHLSSIPQAITTRNADTSPSQKRRINAEDGPSTSSKRVCIAIERDDSATEDESDLEPNMRSVHRGDSSESESEPEPGSVPKPTTPSHLKGKAPMFASSRNAPPPTKPPNAHNRSTQPSKPATSWNPPSSANASSPNTAAKPPTSSTSYLAAHSLPNNLNNINELVNWALKLAEDQARALDQGVSVASTSRAPQPSSTTNHITQSIATHRARLNGNKSSDSPPNSTPASQLANASQATPRLSTPSDDGVDEAATSSANKKSKRRKKSKLSDFPGLVGEIASAAIPRFLATVITQGSYEEDTDVFRDWARDAYRTTWGLEAAEHEYVPPPKAVLTIMTRRASWVRGKVKERIRTVVQYGHGFRNPATCRSDVKHNKRLARKLQPNVFHCLNLEPDTNQYEHPEFIRAIGAGLFWEEDAIGVVFREEFNPITLPAAALVLTMMQVCIAEWETGYFKPQDLDVDKQRVYFESHLLGLYEYEKVAYSRLLRFRGEWFAAGIEYSGSNVAEDDPRAARPYTLASQVRPDTPPL